MGGDKTTLVIVLEKKTLKNNGPQAGVGPKSNVPGNIGIEL